MGGLWLAWLFWFCEALALCVGAKPNVPNALAKNFLCALGIFLFFSVSGCCLVRYRSVGSGGRPAIATNSLIYANSPNPFAAQLSGHQVIYAITTQNAHCVKPLLVTPNAPVQDSLCAETDLSQNYPSPFPQQPPAHQPRPR